MWITSNKSKLSYEDQWEERNLGSFFKSIRIRYAQKVGASILMEYYRL